jgi:hypothetical protein
MTPQPERRAGPKGYGGDRPDAPSKPRKRARPNALGNAQVLPPHNVNLTLSPATHEDIHVPAHVSGADLSHEAPGDADHPTTRQTRSAKTRQQAAAAARIAPRQ